MTESLKTVSETVDDLIVLYKAAHEAQSQNRSFNLCKQIRGLVFAHANVEQKEAVLLFERAQRDVARTVAGGKPILSMKDVFATPRGVVDPSAREAFTGVPKKKEVSHVPVVGNMYGGANANKAEDKPIVETEPDDEFLKQKDTNVKRTGRNKKW